ncbi:MAG: hypothetical protein SO014_09535, partial [Candidatus Limivicinus sp.]|nr:hypothetical protein [Candidatus Limivicinus sp.]
MSLRTTYCSQRLFFFLNKGRFSFIPLQTLSESRTPALCCGFIDCSPQNLLGLPLSLQAVFRLRRVFMLRIKAALRPLCLASPYRRGR